MTNATEPMLPTNWAIACVDDILTDGLSNGRSVRTAKEGFPVLRLTALKNGRIDLSERKVGEWTRATAEPYLVKRGDFFIARGNGSIRLVGRGGLLDVEPDPVAYPDTLIRARPHEEVIAPKYFAFVWDSYDLRLQIEKRAKTTAGIYKVNQKDIGACKFPVPPLPEQRRIVEAIETNFTKLDAAEATLKRIQANLKRYRASVLKAAVEGTLVPTEAALARQDSRDYEPANQLLERILTERRRRWEESELAKLKAKGKAPKNDKWKRKYKEPTPPDTTNLPDLPEGWCWVCVDQLVWEIGQGWSPKCEGHPSVDDNSWGVMKTSAVQHMRFDEVENKQLPKSKQPRPGLELVPGDLLITRAGPRNRVGVCCLVKKTRPRLMLCDKVYRLRLPADTFDPRLLELILNAPPILDEIGRLKTGISDSGVNLTQKRFRDIAIPLPPLGEQSRIIAAVEHSWSIAVVSEDQIAKATLRIYALRQSILKQAFEGKLAPQDPNDEPAAVLLERITSEREAMQAKQKKTRRPRKKTARKKSRKS